MSETPQPSTPPSPVAPPPIVPPQEHSERLYQAAAWVAIVAGVVLIAVVILRFAWFLCY
ncbi:MAG TPA: hypothetical protein VEI45_18775 [Mycobacterium sp.]|jgi:hypothetical protein|uniref:hypothetical protein n=1 Tax=Mycobacterium sp. TaxID=1785 RepID=UPI002D2F159B|nr:hypothetical protein [Mycobacterium sp.]HXY66342.1 hypothetical protein [Mycobacterium sp.]